MNLKFLKICAVCMVVLFFRQVDAEKIERGHKMNEKKVREPAVAGMFYTSSKSALLKQINEFLSNVDEKNIDGDILALVSPHAGYVYSGQTAAYGYKLLEGQKYDTVIIIGPNHRAKGFYGTSVYNGDFFKTPLGNVPIDKEFGGKIMSYGKKFVFHEGAHQFEHSIEVQIPFLQVVLKDFSIVPIVMGDYSTNACEDLSDAIVKSINELKNKKILIIASTDLAHGHSYDATNSMDKLCIKDIIEMNRKKLEEHYKTRATEMCGYGPVLTTVLAAKALGYEKTKFLKYINSLDVGGSADWIVGYASIVIYKNNSSKDTKEIKNEEQVYSGEERKELLDIARKSMKEYVENGKKTTFSPKSAKLKENRGGFVTLKKKGQLRGCIGYIVAVKPLYETVAEMAINAAVNDTRFCPVTKDELDDIDIEISVLSPLETITDPSKIQVGKHGLIIRKGFYSGLLLPQVATEYGWDRQTFLEHTCNKAGLPADAWKKGAEIQVFSAEVFGEKE
ncbi:AmmeMemoRadiSam system protein B [Chlamydiota bacterium]